MPDQRQLDLPGYPGGTDIVGNWVNQQFQLDAFGEALLLFAAAAGHDHLDADGWRAAEIAVEAIEQRWQEPDTRRGDLGDRTRRVDAQPADLRRRPAPRSPSADPAASRPPDGSSLADRIVSDTAAHALHHSGRWQRSPSDPRPDAALLLAAIRGAIPPTDPRSIATLHAVDAELTQDGYCYRYRPDERPLGESEGAFLLCGFWMALAHAQQGDRVTAARWFERNRAACGPPGLCSEEFDVAQRQLRGNLPKHSSTHCCSSAPSSNTRPRAEIAGRLEMRAYAPTSIEPRSLRLLIGARTLWGAALLIAPGAVLSDLPHQRIDRPARAFARILGARHLIEAAITSRRHTRRLDPGRRGGRRHPRRHDGRPRRGCGPTGASWH